MTLQQAGYGMRHLPRITAQSVTRKTPKWYTRLIEAEAQNENTIVLQMMGAGTGEYHAYGQSAEWAADNLPYTQWRFDAFARDHRVNVRLPMPQIKRMVGDAGMGLQVYTIMGQRVVDMQPAVQAPAPCTAIVPVSGVMTHREAVEVVTVEDTPTSEIGGGVIGAIWDGTLYHSASAYTRTGKLKAAFGAFEGMPIVDNVDFASYRPARHVHGEGVICLPARAGADCTPLPMVQGAGWFNPDGWQILHVDHPPEPKQQKVVGCVVAGVTQRGVIEQTVNRDGVLWVRVGFCVGSHSMVIWRKENEVQVC